MLLFNCWMDVLDLKSDHTVCQKQTFLQNQFRAA